MSLIASSGKMPNSSQQKGSSIYEQILHSIAQVFQDAQNSYVGHRKYLTILKKIQQRAFELGNEDDFNLCFCRLVNKVLPVKKSEDVADRIVKLVANFASSLQKDDENKKMSATKKEIDNGKKNQKPLEEKATDYLENTNDESNDQQAIQEKEKDEDELDVNNDEEDTDAVVSRFINYLVHHLLRGIESKDKNVRYRVMHLISLLMNTLKEIEEDLYSTLTWEVKKRLFDKEPSVRIKAVLCIARFQDESPDAAALDDPDSASSNLLFVIQNDSSADVRRAALFNLYKAEATLPYLMERAKDVSSINRKSVFTRVMKEIGDFRLLNKNIREKILTWGLKDREPTVQAAAVKMFCNQWYANVDQDLMELLERLHLVDSKIAEIAMGFFFKQKPEILDNLHFEEDYWRKLNVETSFLANLFFNYCITNSLNDTIDKNFPDTTEFASILTKYLKVRKTILMNDNSDSDKIKDINFVIEQLLYIALKYDYGDEIGRREMLQALRLGLYDELTEIQVEVTLKVLLKISINVRDFCQMISEIIIDIRDEEEEEEFSLDMEMDLDSNDDEVQQKNKKRMNRALQCMLICKHMLMLTNEPLRDNIPVTSLLDSVINPAIRSKILPIRECGVTCLGLCCLLDEQLAVEQLAFFGICCSKGDETLQLASLRIIFDILSTFGPKVLDVENHVDTLSMHKLFFRALRKLERPGVQALTAEGLCKLYLNDIFNDDELFETLILAYFSSQNNGNEDLLQILSFCLPVYAFSHPDHQARLSRIAADAFTRLYNSYEEMVSEGENAKELSQSMSSPSNILQQLIYWTDAVNLVNSTDEEVLLMKHHYQFAYNLCEFLSLSSDTASSSFKKVVATNLIKFNIYDDLQYSDLNNLYDKAITARDDIMDEADGQTIKAMERFIGYLERTCNVAEEREKEQGVINREDQKFVQALMSTESGHSENKKTGSSDEDLKENEENDVADDSKNSMMKEEEEYGEADEDNYTIPNISLSKITANSSIVIGSSKALESEDVENEDQDNSTINDNKTEDVIMRDQQDILDDSFESGEDDASTREATDDESFRFEGYSNEIADSKINEKERTMQKSRQPITYSKKSRRSTIKNEKASDILFDSSLNENETQKEASVEVLDYSDSDTEEKMRPKKSKERKIATANTSSGENVPIAKYRRSRRHLKKASTEVNIKDDEVVAFTSSIDEDGDILIDSTMSS